MFKPLRLAALRRPVFAPEAETGADAAGAAAGVDPDAAAAGAAAAAAGADLAQAAAASAAPTQKWWETDRFTPEARDYLTAKGLTVDDPLEALPKIIAGHVNAERRLGQPADQLLSRPKKDQAVGDWMRENRELFGIPEKADGYEIERPKDLGDGVAWDEGFEATARQIAHEHGVPQAALNAFVGVYADRVKSMLADADTELQSANAQMMEALQKDWGNQTPARLAQAQQGAQALAQAAGLDAEAMQNLAMALKPRLGDANTIRLFQKVGEMLGEDSGLAIGQGAGGFGMTPAEARAELSRQQNPGGEWYEATEGKDRDAVARLKPKIEQLSRLAAQR